ncbi:hypothetical protein PAXRUDRAFT_765494, partial [Paxillus rubicundulus Ve08.2h10]
KASCSDKEVKELVLYLHNHRSTAGDGSSFTDPTFNAAAEHLVLYLKSGSQKTGKMVKARWMVVCTPSPTLIKTYQGLSDCHWDSANGCSVQGKEVEVVWEEYYIHYNVMVYSDPSKTEDGHTTSTCKISYQPEPGGET